MGTANTLVPVPFLNLLYFMHVQVRNVTKTFGNVRANDQISLDFAGGQIHGIVGENGAGKSTLMKVLSGFLRPDAGDILLDRELVRLDNPARALRAGIGMIHQDPLDIPAFTVLENFYCASPRAAMPNLRVARHKLLTLAQELGFPVNPDTPIARLTVGQRQQLEITRLLAWGARMLILDEPTTGITTTQKATLFAALRRLAAEHGTTILFVSHKLDEIADLCHTSSVLRAGRVMGEGQMQLPQSQEHLLSLMFGQEHAARRSPAPGPSTPTPEKPDRPVPTWQLDAVTVHSGNLILRDLTITFPPGSAFGLSGLEGSGQQVLLRLLAGRLQPGDGHILLQGKDVTGAPPPVFRQAGVQYLPADRMADGLVGQLTLRDHIALTRAHDGVFINRREAHEAAQQAIAGYAIKATPTTPLSALSGGNQQRAMLALLPDQCSGLLLDQPTRGLDVVSARAIWQRLLARRAAGTTLVFASADFEELLTYSDYILVFFAGQVSPPLPVAELTEQRLAEMIGGIGFEALHGKV